MSTPLKCILLDVGGTLWSSRWAGDPAVAAARVANLQHVLPSGDHVQAAQLERRLHERYAEHRRAQQAANSLVQDTNGVIREVAAEFALSSDDQTVARIRTAMRVSPIGHLTVFPGAVALVQQAHGWGLRCVAVSNATWRDSAAYRQDFADVGLGPYIAAAVSSVDVGVHKPHPAMFETALRITGYPAADCVMIGNSEAKDIAPARALGMRTILVAMEQPPPAGSAAHAVADSLTAVTTILRSWG